MPQHPTGDVAAEAFTFGRFAKRGEIFVVTPEIEFAGRLFCFLRHDGNGL